MPAGFSSESAKGEPWNRPLHALRHGFADTLKQQGVSEGLIEDLSGRLGQSKTWRGNATMETDSDLTSQGAKPCLLIPGFFHHLNHPAKL